MTHSTPSLDEFATHYFGHVAPEPRARLMRALIHQIDHATRHHEAAALRAAHGHAAAGDWSAALNACPWAFAPDDVVGAVLASCGAGDQPTLRDQPIHPDGTTRARHALDVLSLVIDRLPA